MSEIVVFPDQPALVEATAEHIARLAEAAIMARGRFSIGLSGGSTPRPVFQRLAAEPLRSRIAWQRVHVFWGDERTVPPDDPDSNYGMARDALLEHVPLPAANIYRMKGELDPAAAAEDYAAVLRTFFGADGLPRFDLLLQGMGADGHTASLFPGTAALHEQRAWVVANRVPKLDTWRLTLTVPVINAAANITFLVAGADKAPALRAVLEGDPQPDAYPSQRIQPVDGALRWYVDTAAAAQLERRP